MHTSYGDPLPALEVTVLQPCRLWVIRPGTAGGWVGLSETSSLVLDNSSRLVSATATATRSPKPATELIIELDDLLAA
jgi:hypothetical protein